jgi:transcriptional regulator with XRE-family HTH domain
MQTTQTLERPAIGTVIKAWKQAAGMRSKDLAEASGFTRPYISELESNRIDHPSTERLEQIARALKIPVQYLIDRRLPSDPIEIDEQPVTTTIFFPNQTSHTTSHSNSPNPGTPRQSNNNRTQLPSAGRMLDWLLLAPWLEESDQRRIDFEALRVTSLQVADVLQELLDKVAQEQDNTDNHKAQNRVTELKTNTNHAITSASRIVEAIGVEPSISIGTDII